MLVSMNAGLTDFTTKYNSPFSSSLILNGYDADLNLKYTKVLPGNTSANTDFSFRGHTLDIVSNDGKETFDTLYGQLDISNGNWLKFEKLEKKNIHNTYQATNNLWYKDHFVLVYQSSGSDFSKNRILSLQQNSY